MRVVRRCVPQVSFHRYFSEDTGRLEYDFHFPTSYSHRTQPSEDGKTWYFPLEGSDDEWLVCSQALVGGERAAAAAPAAAGPTTGL
jgi:hypothetical protein